MTRLARAIVASSLAPLSALLLYGCGGAQRAEAPPASPSTSPSLVQPTETSPAPAAAPSPAPPPPPPPPTIPAAESSDGPTGRDELRAARQDLDRAQRELDTSAGTWGACDAACRALASMERATAHLCSLAEEPDDKRRCQDARERLTSAQGRVRSACGACR